jgi:CheY-like chemotaxis protein
MTHTLENAVNSFHSASAQPVRTVLYVEDHPVNVQLMKAIFARRPDYRLVFAIDGESGMDAARRCKPDLLLLDINLPDCLGTELLQRMRAMRGWDNVPAVAVTAEHDFDTLGTTFCEMWPKPIRLQDTLNGLDRLLLDGEDDHDPMGTHTLRADPRSMAVGTM